MAGERVRIFISSPGDVGRERLRASMVVRRLDREFRRFFNVEAYFWEHEVQLATRHFQDNIKPPSEFDIVVLILWSRLGTHLPERTGTREYRGIDGRAPVTGTEWEYEEALDAHKRTGAPAVLVFRNRNVANVSTDDLTLRARQLQQLEALDGFWRRHFEDRGIFKTASNSYRGLDEFEERLERQLRQLLEDLIKRGSPDPGARDISWRECPFRGLEAYDFVHSPIFFGRDAAVRQALEQLVANASDGTAFLLVLGASGSGKSSLVRAGLLPELWVPRAVRGVGAWRRVVFHPGESPRDLFLGLASRIVQASAHEPGVGLPEIVSQGYSAADLAAHLRANPGSPGEPLRQTLDGLALVLAQHAHVLDREHVLHGEEVRLVLVIDQLEELFTDAAVAPEERVRFTELLAGLARSGAVWVVATMRSDFWHRAAEAPLLAELASGSGRLDLWPPNRAELTEIIRRPAAAAGLRFGEDAERVSLDARLADDAASDPGTLPLLSYTLEALFIGDVDKARGETLRWETYEEIGHLQGAIARRADDTVANLARDGVDDRVIARVLRRLVGLDDSEGSRIVARSAPLGIFPVGTPERHLIDAFLDRDMRLLIAEGDAAEARIRVAHEALLSGWDRARHLIAEDALNLSRRRRIEESELRWRGALEDDRPGLLLRSGLELNEAEALVAAWANELDPGLLVYVEESWEAERRRVEEREQNARRLAERLAEAQLNQSRFLTSIAETELRDGNIERAMLIAREALPRDMRKPDRPVWNGAFEPMAKARMRDRAIAIAVGHQGLVTNAAFGPDGKRVVTASWDGTARLWDGASGAALAILDGHSNWVRNAAFSPDGKRVVTASDDGTARLWDGARGVALATLDGHTSDVNSVAFSPDGKRVVTASRDTTARLWDGESGAPLATLEGHSDGVQSAVFSPDGRRVVTTSHNIAVLWDGASGAPLASLKGHTEGISSAAFSPDGQRVVTASFDRTARLWDGASGAALATLEGHTDRVWSAAFSPDGTRVVTASEDRTARLWDGVSGAPLASLEGHTDRVQSAVFSPDCTRIVTASQDRTARLWDGASGASLATLEGHGSWLNSAVFSPDGRRIVTASEDKTARLWDGASGALVATLEGRTDDVWSAAFSPDGTRVVIASDDQTARPCDGACCHPGFGLGRTAFSHDGKRVLTASDDGTGRLCDGASGTPLATLEGPDLAWGAAFTPDGRRVVTATADGTARLWDGVSGAPLATLEGHSDLVWSAAFSPGGTQVVTASQDGTARMWDGASGAPLATLEGHLHPVLSAAFSPDGERVVTASEDNTARMWPAWPLLSKDTATYVAIAALRSLTPEERSRAFLAAAAVGTADATTEPDSHRQLAEGFERAAGAGCDLEQALFHYAVAVRLFEEQGREEEAAPCRMRRGSLARVLPPQSAVRIAYEAMDWTPTAPG